MKTAVMRTLVSASIALGMVILLCACAPEGIILERQGSYSPAPAPRNSPPPWAPAHGKRAQHAYRYYPSSMVYYDEHQGVYFHCDMGTWRVSVELPRSVSIDLNEYVTLEMDTAEPYRYHEQVIVQYPPGKVKKQKNKKKG